MPPTSNKPNQTGLQLPQCPQCGTALEGALRPASANEASRLCEKCGLPLILIAGKYILEEKMGGGGGGVLYLARHHFLPINPLRVIKFIRPLLFAHETSRKRFLREIQVTSVISQENQHIVRIYDDFGTVKGLGDFYVMEYLKGQDLQVYLAKGQTLTLEQILMLGRQLCEAVHVAHQADVIHRDIKPSNIFLVDKQTTPVFVKVMDFGIAKEMGGERLTSPQQRSIGTPMYMAPEQYTGNKSQVDHRADIYAIGMILYELLVGHPPFLPPEKLKTITAMELAQLKWGQPIPPVHEHTRIPGLSQTIADAVMKALATQQEERFQTAHELGLALEMISAPNVSSDPPEPPIDWQRTQAEETPPDLNAINLPAAPLATLLPNSTASQTPPDLQPIVEVEPTPHSQPTDLQPPLEVDPSLEVQQGFSVVMTDIASPSLEGLQASFLVDGPADEVYTNEELPQAPQMMSLHDTAQVPQVDPLWLTGTQQDRPTPTAPTRVPTPSGLAGRDLFADSPPPPESISAKSQAPSVASDPLDAPIGSGDGWLLQVTPTSVQPTSQPTAQPSRATTKPPSQVPVYPAKAPTQSPFSRTNKSPPFPPQDEAPDAPRVAPPQVTSWQEQDDFALISVKVVEQAEPAATPHKQHLISIALLSLLALGMWILVSHLRQ